MAKRGRKPALTPAQQERVRERRRSGVSYRDLAREFGVSQGTIAAALTAVPTKPKRTRTRTTKKPAPAPGPEPRTPTEADLDALIADVEAMVSSAREAGDMSRLAAATRLRIQAIALREKLRPPPAPEPADDPKYVAAAQQTIARLERSLDRAQKRRAEWPTCDECGGNVRPEDDPERDLSPAQRWAAALTEALA